MLQYVTTNPGKLREARSYLGDETIDTFDYDYPEIQAPTLEPIAAEGARDAYREVGGPVIVDDAGLFIDAFEGFPGPYSSFVETTIGVERVWDLAESLDNRAAAFRCVLAYCDGEGFDDGVDRDDAVPVKCFTGVVDGRIVAPRGSGGFGYDPIFEHDGTTFAELSSEGKNEVSHRGRALEAFAEWYQQR